MSLLSEQSVDSWGTRRQAVQLVSSAARSPRWPTTTRASSRAAPT